MSAVACWVLPGQRAYFVSHHGKAAAVFAGAGGFDGGVQRQKIGLLGNAAESCR